MLRVNEILDAMRMRRSLGLHPTDSFCDRPSLYDAVAAQRDCKDNRPKIECYAKPNGIGPVEIEGGTWYIPFSDLRTQELLWYTFKDSLDLAPLERIGATNLPTSYTSNQ